MPGVFIKPIACKRIAIRRTMERQLEKLSEEEMKELLEYNRAYAASDGVKGSPINLRFADLRGYDFRGYDLRYADFFQSGLPGATFTPVAIRHPHFPCT